MEGTVKQNRKVSSQPFCVKSSWTRPTSPEACPVGGVRWSVAVLLDLSFPFGSGFAPEGNRIYCYVPTLADHFFCGLEWYKLVMCVWGEGGWGSPYLLHCGSGVLIIIIIIIDYLWRPSCKSPERLQRHKDTLISSHTHTHTHQDVCVHASTHTHTLQIHALLVMTGKMAEGGNILGGRCTS